VPTATATPDATRCPLCGKANLCAMEVERATGAKQEACWCTQVDFTAELLAELPTEAENLACICAACADRNNAA
jgi:Cysteine-rich CWC